MSSKEFGEPARRMEFEMLEGGRIRVSRHFSREDGDETVFDNPEHALGELAEWLKQHGAFEGRDYRHGDTIPRGLGPVPAAIRKALADNAKAPE